MGTIAFKQNLWLPLLPVFIGSQESFLLILLLYLFLPSQFSSYRLPKPNDELWNWWSGPELLSLFMTELITQRIIPILKVCHFSYESNSGMQKPYRNVAHLQYWSIYKPAFSIWWTFHLTFLCASKHTLHAGITFIHRWLWWSWGIPDICQFWDTSAMSWGESMEILQNAPAGWNEYYDGAKATRMSIPLWWGKKPKAM